MRIRDWVPIVAIGLMASAATQAADQFKVVDEKDVAAFWVPQPGHKWPPPKYPIEAIRTGVESCVEVGFSIQSDGFPANFSALHSTFSGSAKKETQELLKQSAIDAAAAVRFMPSPTNSQGTPVYTNSLISFSLGKSKDDSKAHGEQIRRSCRIENLQEFIASKKGSPN